MIRSTFNKIGNWFKNQFDESANTSTIGEYITSKSDDINFGVKDGSILSPIAKAIQTIIKVPLTPIRWLIKGFTGIADFAGEVADKVGKGFDWVKKKFNKLGDMASGVFDFFTGGGNGEKSLKKKSRLGGYGNGEVNDYPYYSQKDARWANDDYSAGSSRGNMKESGCGPKAMAMVASRYTKNTTPDKIADDAIKGGYRDNTGTNSKFISYEANKLGLKSNQNLSPSADYISSHVGNGKSLILNGVNTGSNNSAFTRSGHYVVAVGKDNNGNILINDPRGENYSRAVNPEELASESRASWSFDENNNVNTKKKGGSGGFGNRFRKIFGGRGKDWLSIVRATKKAVAAQKLGYSQEGYMDIKVDGKKVHMRRDCSGFVSACLTLYTGKTVSWTSYNFASNNSFLKNHGFKLHKWNGWDALQAGDILAVNGHVEIYAGKAKDGHRVYNCGSTSSVNNPNATRSGHKSYTHVWRPDDPGTGDQNLAISGGVSNNSTDSSNSSSSSSIDVISQISELGSQFASKAMNGMLTGKWDTNISLADNGTSETTSSTNNYGADTSNAINEGGASAKKGQTVKLPKNLGTANTWMGWQLIKSPSSMQYKLRQKAGQNFDNHGFGVIDGRYTVATTDTYGKVGDYIDVKRESGNTLKAIIADIKSRNDAGCNKWGHQNGKSVTEFIVDYDSWYHKTNGIKDGNKFHSKYNPSKDNSAVVSITNQGNYFTKGKGTKNKKKGGKGGFGGFGDDMSAIPTKINYKDIEKDYTDTIDELEKMGSTVKIGGNGSKNRILENSKSSTKVKNTTTKIVTDTSTLESLLERVCDILSSIDGNTEGVKSSIKDLKNNNNVINQTNNNVNVNSNTTTPTKSAKSDSSVNTRSAKNAKLAARLAKG